MNQDCELRGERFDYVLKLITVEMPEGNLVNMLACELCAEEFDVTDMVEQERDSAKSEFGS